MQRLINDAMDLIDVQEKLGVTIYDGDFSFDNIVNSISVIQESMGIAGTTSKEAAATIEGSIGSAKAAWENWIAELGKDDADMESRTQELVESVAAAARNIIPRVIKIGGEVLEQLPQLVVQAKETLKAEVLPALDEVTGGAASKIFDALERIGGKVADTAGRLWDKLKPVLDKLMPILEKLGEIVLPVIEGAIDAVGWALDGLISIFDWVIDRISDLLGWFDDLGKAISNAGSALTGQFTNNSSVPSTRPFALGGTVTSPTTALIGEAGYAETVIPNTEWGIAPLARALSRSMGSGSASPVVNISIARVENNRDQDIYDLAHQIGSLTTLSLKTQGFGEPL
jgi:phage-related protein